MNHLEELIAEYLDWKGFLVKQNLKVGKRDQGGWEMELDIVGYNPKTDIIEHYEPSLDAYSWERREQRYRKKFDAARKYIFLEVFPWLKSEPKLKQFAILSASSQNHKVLGGGEVKSVDELVSEIKKAVCGEGLMVKNAIPERYPLLRTIQLVNVGYRKKVE